MRGPRKAQYEFSDLEHLTRWLVTTKWGQAVLRDALHSQQCAELVMEFAERDTDAKPVPTYVLVKAFGDGWIEVYGERHVRANVIELPATDDPEQEKLIDDWVGLNLKLPYQRIDYPSSRRAAGHVTPLFGFGEYVRGLERRDFEQLAIRALNEVKS